MSAEQGPVTIPVTQEEQAPEQIEVSRQPVDVERIKHLAEVATEGFGMQQPEEKPRVKIGPDGVVETPGDRKHGVRDDGPYDGRGRF